MEIKKGEMWLRPQDAVPGFEEDFKVVGEEVRQTKTGMPWPILHLLSNDGISWLLSGWAIHSATATSVHKGDIIHLQRKATLESRFFFSVLTRA